MALLAMLHVLLVLLLGLHPSSTPGADAHPLVRHRGSTARAASWKAAGSARARTLARSWARCDLVLAPGRLGTT